MSMASIAALPEVVPAPVLAQDAPIDMANLPAGVDPVMAQIVANMSPEELAELHAEAGEPLPTQAQESVSADPVADPVATLTAQAQAPVLDSTPAQQAPSADPMLVATLQSIQALVQAQAQENANFRQMLTPKRNPLQDLEEELPPEYRGDPKLTKFIQTLTNLRRGADPNEVAGIKAELAAMKQAAFANDYANRNASAVTSAVIGSVLGGKADVRLPDGSNLADELRELNFAVGAVHKKQPEQAAARTAVLVEAIGKAYVAAMAAKSQATALAVKNAPKPVPAATPAQQAPQSDLTLTSEDIRNAGGNSVRAVFNKAFGRKR